MKKFIQGLILCTFLFGASIYANKNVLVVLIGSPGAGKGTLAQNLCAQGGYQHISAGDMLRAEVQAQTKLGKQIEPLVNQGTLIDVTITEELIKKKIKEIFAAHDSCILDGFPRSKACMEAYDRIIEALGLEDIVYLELVAEKEVCRKRIGKRLVCDECHHVDQEQDETHEGGICSTCQKSFLKRRLNDSDEVAVRRIADYHKKRPDLFQPVADAIYKIDASQSIPECVEQAKSHIQSWSDNHA